MVPVGEDSITSYTMVRKLLAMFNHAKECLEVELHFLTIAMIHGMMADRSNSNIATEITYLQPSMTSKFPRCPC